MPTRQEYEKASLASGEISPALQAATDLRAYQTGVAAQENFVTVLEGIAVRRPGTRFVFELPNEAQKGKLWPFRYSEGDYYMLLLNGGVMRVMRDAGYVTKSGAPFQVAIPWSESDLALLRAAPLKNTLTFTTGTGRIRVVTRIAADGWTVAEYLPLNGPVGAQNLDNTKTVLPSAISGNVTLDGVNGPFDPGMVGGVMRIDEANAALTPLWVSNELISRAVISVPQDALFGSFSNLGNLVDNNSTTWATAPGSGYAGMHFDTATTVSQMALAAPPKGSLGTDAVGFSGFGSGGTGPELTFELWGKVGAAPANAADGVLLGRTVVIDGDGLVVTVYSSDTETVWNNAWFTVKANQPLGTIAVSSADTAKRDPNGAAILRRWVDNIYEAVTDGPAGTQPPVHTEGDGSYGGVVWRFRSKTYGFVRIATVTSANAAAGTVISQLPDSALLAATYRWWPPAWSDGGGWPEIVLQHQQKFLFFRKNQLWVTRPATVDDFGFTADTDSAIAASLAAPDDQSLPEIRWAASAGIVVLGTADIEWMLRAPASNDVLQAQTIDPVPDSLEGSIAQIPTKVDRGVIVVGPTGKRLMYIKFDALTQQLAPEEVSAGARHIPQAGVVAKAWQKDPHKILWMVLGDGTLAAMTFMPAQKIVALHRHPMQNGFVEDIAALPALDDGRTDIYLIVRRTINGQTRRFVELLQPFFEPVDPNNPTAEGAWFVDCGLSYNGPPTMRVSGLKHLENQVVAVFANGAMQQRKRVVNAAVDLDAEASNVVIGIPIKGRVLDLPRSLQLGGGSTRGKQQRANTLVVDVLNTAGGMVRMTHPKQERNSDDVDVPFDDLVETGADDYGDPIKLFTGQIPLTVTDEGASSAVVEIVCDDAMPFSLRAIVPDLIVEGD